MISYLSQRLGFVGYMRGPCCYQPMCKLVIVTSMIGIIHVQPEGGHYQAPKHVVVPYVENTV